ncbi:hypothetical protein E3N88_08208 [Mikania micrantha]|uniref:UBX domain-containing protein n=1 Tax=Mikania micrantha TaxID=192012 RepID=A0A5N6PHM9_9ASTR|nr:hypothetical protein E3N88_08208 [Mikania micrantha]
MATPNQESIDKFISFTRSSKSVAIQKLTEHGGNLNEAVNAHFTEGDRNISEQHVATLQDVFMDNRKPIDLEDVSRLRLSSSIKYGEDIEGLDTNSSSSFQQPPDYSIEEEMIRAAIEASKQDSQMGLGDEALHLARQSQLEDAELAKAVSLSLKTAEQEKALRQLGSDVGPSEPRGSKLVEVEDLDTLTSLNGRLEVESSSIPHEVEEAEEQPLVRNRSRLMSSRSIDSAEDILEELEQQLAGKEASLPHEPTSDDENAVTLLVRMPDGSRRGRRFLRSDKLQHLFSFIDVARVAKPGTYRLLEDSSHVPEKKATTGVVVSIKESSPALLQFKKLLGSVPDRFIAIVALVEQFADLSFMSFQEAIGRLKAFEERIKPKDEGASSKDNQRMLTYDDWQAKKKQEGTKEPGRGGGSTSSRGRGRGSGGGGRGRGNELNQNTYQQRKSKDKSKVKCLRLSGVTTWGTMPPIVPPGRNKTKQALPKQGKMGQP